ncbi:GspE/PulE family protein [Phycisphaerales bacterium AB-hyl4]|uniref:GspE/PulE family protein n=1 Tax=Natronomicrosphaera hydrolytica TaxID=3242702 RepID=A0ABV4TZP2_9BACT
MADPVLARLRELGLLDEQAAEAVRTARSAGTSLDDALLAAVRQAGGDEAAVLKALADEFDLPFVNLEEHRLDSKLLARFPARVLLERSLLPLEQTNGSVLVATARPFDTTGLDELRLASGLEVRIALASPAELKRQLKLQLGVGADTVQAMIGADPDRMGVQLLDDGANDLDLTAAAEDASIVKFVNQVLTEAIERRATDVHFEPFEESLRVRYRIDGVLQQANVPPELRRFQPAIVSRLKILSQLDIAEKRVPQDGRIKLRIAGREVDVRVSIIPMLHGEAVVLRLLDRGGALLGIEMLGMGPRDREAFEAILELPHGIALVTGPTGSGKTTSLYAGLSRINEIDRKIVTIEDPIEYQLEGINQIQVATKAGMTFAKGLRAILRHDPDVILIGEIRDRETAEIAVQASLTGHLVFSTLHTNDAPGALTRLVDMGVEPYLVASSLELVIAQRLVRLICEDCKAALPADESAKARRQFGDALPDVLFEGRGCRSCQNTGYRGRRGIFELMPVTESLRRMILETRSGGEIREHAMGNGMASLRDDGWRLVREGVTTVAEVLRVTKDERREVEGEGG